MTAKFDKFKEALIALCDEHRVAILVSVHDEILVYDRIKRRDYAVGNFIIDCTKEQPTQPAQTPPSRP